LSCLLLLGGSSFLGILLLEDTQELFLLFGCLESSVSELAGSIDELELDLLQS